MNQDEDPASRKRRLAKERKARWLAKQSDESFKRIREADAASHRRRIRQLTPDQLVALRTANAASQRRYIQRLTPGQLVAHRASHAASQRRYSQPLTIPDQALAHPASHAQHEVQLGLWKNMFEQSENSNVPVETNDSEERILQLFGMKNSPAADSDNFFVKPFGCVMCDEMFQIEKEFMEHCLLVCYSPVNDDFAELFED